LYRIKSIKFDIIVLIEYYIGDNSTGWTRSKQEQWRWYQLWATSSCTSGTEQAIRVEAKHGFELN
jgi:hypothetical protein